MPRISAAKLLEGGDNDPEMHRLSNVMDKF